MPTEPLSASERAALRADHQPCDIHAHAAGAVPCFGDHDRLTLWPCPVVRLLDDLEQREAEPFSLAEWHFLLCVVNYAGAVVGEAIGVRSPQVADLSGRLSRMTAQAALHGQAADGAGR